VPGGNEQSCAAWLSRGRLAFPGETLRTRDFRSGCLTVLTYGTVRPWFEAAAPPRLCPNEFGPASQNDYFTLICVSSRRVCDSTADSPTPGRRGKSPTLNSRMVRGLTVPKRRGRRLTPITPCGLRSMRAVLDLDRPSTTPLKRAVPESSSASEDPSLPSSDQPESLTRRSRSPQATLKEQWMYKGCRKDVRAQALVGDGVSFEFTIGSGPGIRTLNLAVNRSLRPIQKPRSEFAECR